MARKRGRGYYVDGSFVAAGSAEDAQFRTELRGTEAPSRTARKQASEGLQALGEALAGLRADLFATLPLPDKLREAIVELGRINNFEGERRQKQFIGKLMRGLDDDVVEAITAALRLQHSQAAADARRLHELERWRAELIADDARLAAWLDAFPATDAQQLRALIRQARREAVPGAPGAAPRQGRAYRQIFTLLRAQQPPPEAASDDQEAGGPQPPGA